MAEENRKAKSGKFKEGANRLRNFFNRGKKSRRPIKDQEVSQRGNVQNLDEDEYSTR
ncbi:MAG: hypothetical protein KC478_06545 [Bacteriovoracaceae bacterium]|nr:hypothetical protein [Bacteriovoracaceae bacterium]